MGSADAVLAFTGDDSPERLVICSLPKGSQSPLENPVALEIMITYHQSLLSEQAAFLGCDWEMHS